MTFSKTLLLSSYLDGSSSLSGINNPHVIREEIAQSIENEASAIIEIDMKGLESLSPSFAYEAFGKLVDQFGSAIKERLIFTNDELNLSRRILDAFVRRASVRAAESKAV